MQLMNTILGFVLECETDYKVFNPSQEQWYTLSKEQFSKLNVGNFFTFKEIVYSCSNKDVISCDGHFYFVKNRRFFDLETGKQLRTPPVPTNSRGYTKFVAIHKRYFSYKDVATYHCIDKRTLSVMEVSAQYNSPEDSVHDLHALFEDMTFSSYLDFRWERFYKNVFIWYPAWLNGHNFS